MASSLVLNRTPKRPAEDTAAFGAIAERFRRAGALDKAVSLCREGLKKFPDHASARVTLGWALLDLGKYDEAREELEQVLRRAPDNLAAIRGLAELHDRFEHTLNLPMDGPGHWPPTPADVEQIGDAGSPRVEIVSGDEAPAPITGINDADGPEAPVAPMMAPPQMGMPIWAAVAPVSRAADVVAESLPADRPEDENAAAAPVAAANSGSGMSSVREIEFSSGARSINVAAAAPAPPAQPDVDHFDQVGNVDLDALIAEADSLEAAALAVQAVEATAVEATDVTGPADLDPVVTLDAAATLDLVADVDLSAGPMAEQASAETIETAGPMDALVAELERAPLPEPVSEPVLQLDELDAEPEVVLQAEASEATLAVAEPDVAPAVVESEVASALAEPEAGQALEHSEAEPFGQPEAATAPEPVRILEFAPAKAETFHEPAAEHGTEPAAELATDAVAPAAAVAVAEVVRIHPALPALERFLAQVQARRVQLMTESVA